jgi:hypothetical protein
MTVQKIAAPSCSERRLSSGEDGTFPPPDRKPRSDLGRLGMRLAANPPLVLGGLGRVLRISLGFILRPQSSP